jgi:hypothetical protein
MSKDPEPVLFVRRVLQTLAPAASAGVSQTDEHRFLLARHAAVVNQYADKSPSTWIRQNHFWSIFMFSLFIPLTLIRRDV